MKWMLIFVGALSFVTPGFAQGQATSPCPDNFVAFAGTTDTLTCSCDESAAGRGSVWGMDVYTGDSSICRAAVHAGAISRRGGQVSVVPEQARQAYPGVTRNGISSNNYGRYGSSFRFAGSPSANPQSAGPAPATPTAAAASSPCPDNFLAFADTTEALSCGCDASATGRGSVWGMDLYTGDSAICRAALHAGAVPRQGGQVTVSPEPGRQAYPGLTRNGVQSNNYGPYASSYRFVISQQQASAVAPAAPAAPPVQQNIQTSLRDRGQVDLYIQFKTNSADLEISAADTMRTLLSVMASDPNLKLTLIGHTDSVGAPQYNRSLSYRRAEAVANWLVQQGVASNRLSIDGRGQEEPIADNASEYGRATNRRVQALRR